MDKEQVLSIVKKYLDIHKPDGVPIEVLERGVRWEGKWWRVPVRLTEEIARRTHFYDELADAEIDIKDKEGVEVFFFPNGTTRLAEGVAQFIMLR